MEGVNLVSTSLNQQIMQEVGRTLVSDPDKILDLLESNDIDVASLSSPIDLGDLFLYELPYSEALQLGTAYLIERNNSSFSGEVSNENIYSMFEAISDYWQDEEDYPEDEEPNSNVVGAVLGGLKLAKKFAKGRNRSQNDKQQESRDALIQGVIAQKKAEAEALQKKTELEAKNKRIATISIVSIVGVIAIITAMVYIKKQKNG